MKRILVTTDFSDMAASAFEAAASLANQFDATVVVAYVVDSLEYNAAYPYPDLTRFQGEIEAAARAGLSRAAEKLTALGVRHVETVYRVGTPAAEIADIAEQEPGCDLLVIATHGWTGFRRFIIGSVTEAIVRRVRIPVLSVHSRAADAKPFDVRKIVVASDLSELSDAAVKQAAALAAGLGAQLEVVHVFRGPAPVAGMDVAFTVPLSADDIAALRQSFQRALDEQVQRLGLEQPVVATLLEGTNPAEAITDYALTGGFDLLVASSHGRRGVQRLVMGSVAERLMRMSEVPVMIVKGS